MIHKKVDVAVVGGGVVGLSTALELNEAGLSVCVIDKSELAQESSWAGGGILSPLYPWRYDDAINALAFRSQVLYPELVSHLMEFSHIDPEYVRCGMLIDSKDINENALSWIRAHSLPFDSVSPETYAQIRSDKQFSFFPTIAQVRNPRFASAMKATLQNKQVKLIANEEVRQIQIDPGNTFRLKTPNSDILAEKVVVCAGAWTAKVLASLDTTLPIKPVKGQMLLYKADPDFLSCMILSEGKYIIPRKDGRVLVGSTMEDVGFDKSVSNEEKNSLQHFAESTCPGLSAFPIEKHWAGLRPGSPKGIPYIGEHPAIPNLFVNAGHFRNGVILAPASAELLRDLMMGRQSNVNPGSYQLPCEEAIAE